jgi:PhzF family phenazine biosynthesis protein
MIRPFKQVDVFTAVPFKGNPLAVVFGADDLDDAQMQAIARWTNLSETTFVLQPEDPAADYRVRIFTTDQEFPFAGHPTLGTAHAVLQSGLRPRQAGRLVQQCGIGLVPVLVEDDGALAFEAPPATFAPLDPALAPLLSQALNGAAMDPAQPPALIDMGIRWLVVRLASADACLAWQPEAAAIDALQRRSGANGIAVFGAHANGGPTDFEVQVALAEHGMLIEDPVTGSANACIARLLRVARGDLPYHARQGTALGRDGRIAVTYRDGVPWIAGHVLTIVDGEIALP